MIRSEAWIGTET